MMHKARRWGINPVATARELAIMLTQRTWTLCSGFYVLGHEEYLFLNDATHEDGAGEFGIVRVLGPSQWIQVESITFSWCSVEAAEGHISAALAGGFDAHDFTHAIFLRGQLDGPGEHGHCGLCA
jgi:hypothetical protein